MRPLLQRTLVLFAVLLSACDGPGTGTAPRTVASLTVSPQQATIFQNHWAPLQAIAFDSNGVQVEEVDVRWSTSDHNVAYAIPSQHLPSNYGAASVSAIGIGTATITAMVGDAKATMSVTVARAPVVTVEVSPANRVIIVGQTLQLGAVTKDPNNYTLTGRPVTWQSSNAFATVTSTGLVTGVSPGDAFITARSEGASGTVLVRVISPTVEYEYYKRGGPMTPSIATLNISATAPNGTLSIDGQQYAMSLNSNVDGVYCFLSALANGLPGRFTACGYKRDPLVIWLCSGLSDTRVLEYVLFPAGATDRVPSTASALLAAVQSNTTQLGIEVFAECRTSGLPPRWVRNAPGTDYYFWPNTATVRSAAEVRALLDGALIYSAPNAGTNFNQYAALRMGPGIFEIWH